MTATYLPQGLRAPARITLTAAPSASGRFGVVGLSDAAAREAQVRVGCALNFWGAPTAVTVTVAGLPEGASTAGLDLPIALTAMGISIPEGTLVLGELSLDGTLRPTRGTLAALRAPGLVRAILPRSSASTAALSRLAGGRVEILAVDTLREAADLLRDACTEPDGEEPRPFALLGAEAIPESERLPALAALAAKRTPVLLLGGGPGNPGIAGNFRRAQAALNSLPALDAATWAGEIAPRHDLAGLLAADTLHLTQRRPFRAPHHSVSEAGLVGSEYRPGELDLAHEGALVLDEIGEFRGAVVEAVRDAMRHGTRLGGKPRPWLVLTAQPGDERALRFAERLGAVVVEVGP